MSRPTTPQVIRYETENYLVRELELEDASERVCAWMADPTTARMLNAPVRALGLDDLRKYISSHDRIDGHLLGIFDKETDTQAGLWSIYVDWERKEFLINILTVDRGKSELGPRRETGRPLLMLMFDEWGMEAMRCNVLAHNHKIDQRFENRNIAPEHKSSVRSASDQSMVEINHYTVTRQMYYQMRKPTQNALESAIRKAV